MILRFYEILIVVPMIAFLVVTIGRHHELVTRDLLTVIAWALAITVVDLLPVPHSSSFTFSLSFPLELSTALIYLPPVAAAVAFVGSADVREFRREQPVMKALVNRAQVAFSVLVESTIFHSVASLHSPWYVMGSVVLLAAVGGYTANTLIVAEYFHLGSGERLREIVRSMHVGVFGEFLVSYMGLALFSVLVAVSFVRIGALAILVCIAPLMFARQMFRRTASLQLATDELAVKQAENEYQALHDGLTGLPNRVLFQRRLADAIEHAQEVGGGLAVMLMDLDHFKEINDTLGHHFGDGLLREIGPRLADVLREGHIIARLGGDEFGVLVSELPEPEIALRIAARLLEALELPISVENLALDVSGSIGIAMYPEQAADAETLLRRADVAMYAAKESGGGWELYRDELEHGTTQITVLGSVRPALENGEIAVYFQPKLRLSDGLVSGAEALVRWEHPQLGLVPADEFVPVIERTVLLRQFTQSVLDESLKWWRAWFDQGIRLQVAVNVSPRSLLDQTLPEQVSELLTRWDAPPSYLKLELTESFLMVESSRSAGVLERLSRVGVGLSIDDFGTGYSSLSHLKRLPITEIKIDRSFVTNMRGDMNDMMIVRATVELGKNLGLSVVAEGVEDRETWDDLAGFGCDECQGFFVSEPMPANQFTQWLSVRGPSAINRSAPAAPGMGLRAV